MFSEYHAVGSASAAFMLAHGRFKYHHYVGYPPELFDLQDDPQEEHDLGGSPDHRDVLRDCEARLRAIVDPQTVDRQAKDDQNAVVERAGGLGDSIVGLLERIGVVSGVGRDITSVEDRRIDRRAPPGIVRVAEPGQRCAEGARAFGRAGAPVVERNAEVVGEPE